MHRKKKPATTPDKIVRVCVFYVDLTKSKLDVQEKATQSQEDKT